MDQAKRNRRQFLRISGGTAAGLIGASVFGKAAASGNLGRTLGEATAQAMKRAKTAGAVVVVARDPGMWKAGKLDGARVEKLLLKAVRTLAGAKTDAQAWGRYFDAKDRVGIKVNCLAGRELSTTPELSRAIAAGLRAAGVTPGNIIIFDRTGDELERAGFILSTAEQSVKVAGTDSPGVGYEKELSLNGEVGSLVSRIVTRYCTALISAPALKDHDLCGVSGCMKNFFGAINNPNKLHMNNCDPYIADCFGLPEFSDRVRLFISDATLAQYHAGPGYKPAYAWKFGGVIVSDDPVALDAVCLSLIEKKRKEKGLPTLESEGRPARFLATAAAPPRSLGVADIKRIVIKEIT